VNTLREKKIALFRKVSKERGIKVTHQRLEIFLEVVDAADHPSAEDVFRRVQVRIPTVSLDTVYRTLSTFDKQSLITRVNFFEDKTRFDPKTNQHHHLVCRKCRSVMDLYWQEIDAVSFPSETYEWGRVDGRRVQLIGLCSKCLSEEEGESNRDKCQDQDAQDRQDSEGSS
jgi:Fur family peroxide stress response transcriptional regulator